MTIKELRDKLNNLPKKYDNLDVTIRDKDEEEFDAVHLLEDIKISEAYCVKGTRKSLQFLFNGNELRNHEKEIYSYLKRHNYSI